MRCRGQYKVLIYSDVLHDVRHTNEFLSVGRHLSHSGVAARDLQLCSCIMVAGCRRHVHRVMRLSCLQA